MTLALEPGSTAELTARYGPAARWLTSRRWPVALAGAALATGRNHSAQPDLILFARAGGRILTGHLAGVYAAPWEQGGPFELVGTWLLLPFGFQHRTGYLRISDGPVSIPMHAAGAALLLLALMATVRGLRRGLGRPDRTELEVLVGVLAVATGLPQWMWWGGHLSQLVLGLGWLWTALLAYRGRGPAAALLLGLSAGWESWAVLGAPLLLLDPAPRRLVRSAVVLPVAAALPYLPFVLAGPFRMFRLAWSVTPWSFFHRLFPAVSHVTWSVRVGQTLAVLAVGSAVALLLRRRPDAVWVAPLAITLTRQLTDPLQLDYYWLPLFLIVLVAPALLTLRTGTAGVLVGLGLAGLPALVALPVVPLGPTAGWAYLPAAALTVAAVGLARRAPADAVPSRPWRRGPR